MSITPSIEKPEASGQRVRGRLFCRCFANAAGNEEVMDVRRRRQSRYLEKLFSLFLDVEETVFSSDSGNGLASPQPEAGLSYFQPCPLPPPPPPPPPPPQPFLWKGRVGWEPLGSRS